MLEERRERASDRQMWGGVEVFSLSYCGLKVYFKVRQAK